MVKRRGVFISFEGIEGAGKSTVMKLLAKELRKTYGIRSLVLTREPGGTESAEKIRDIVVNHDVHPVTELFLMEAARAEHVSKLIRPALQRGAWVLCDRFADSSLAYQGHARGLGWNMVVELNHLATQGLKPDRTVFLAVSPAVGLKRARVQTRFEKAGIRFQEKVRQGFLRAKRENPGRWIEINTEKFSPDQAVAIILQKLRGKLK